jgi:photosynthetic reaction center H subunit
MDTTGTGNIGGYLDIAQVVLYIFWFFFAGLIFYLHRENKREGYPLDSDRLNGTGGRIRVVGWPPLPKSKTYCTSHGTSTVLPNDKRDTRPIAARPTAPFPGAPLEPIGDPMLAAVGPGSYAERADDPDLTYDGQLKILPLRLAPEFHVVEGSHDPRGRPVIGADGEVGGTVSDLWVDRSEAILRYIEVEVPGKGKVLLPYTFSVVTRRNVQVKAILASQFANVPTLRNPDRVTLLEEDKITGYFGGGTLYATPERREPLI